jgi:hypothetical protein
MDSQYVPLDWREPATSLTGSQAESARAVEMPRAVAVLRLPDYPVRANAG